MSLSVRHFVLAGVLAGLGAGCGQQLVHFPISQCTDSKKDEAETDVDCGGGACPSCGEGKACLTGTDCASGLCLDGKCNAGAAICTDGKKDGDETDTDCGGAKCPKCGDSHACLVASDCQSGVCTNGSCQVSTCSDKVRNGMETDVDCGGGSCPSCPNGDVCGTQTDCQSGVCISKVCSPSSCQDGAQNGDETDVDCGGSCAPCADGKGCAKNGDCKDGVCVNGVCQAPTCSDSVKNGAETDVDCGGGSCKPCQTGKMCMVTSDCAVGVCLNSQCAPASCTDGRLNGDETDDCGGSCLPCGTAQKCVVPKDCKSLDCVSGVCLAATCSDVILNQDESDVDCGGATCNPCQLGQKCLAQRDCASAACFNGLCVPPSCADNLKNGAETDLDCGGGACAGCATGKVCVLGRDCASGVCTGGVCQAPACSDSVINGTETDKDCGGSTCGKCPDLEKCRLPSDCQSGVCLLSFSGGVCQVPTCTDKVKNGKETDVDCGGPSCTACGVSQACTLGSDCWDANCQSNGKCGATATVVAGTPTGAAPFSTTTDGSQLVVLDSNKNISVNRAQNISTIARYVWVSNSGEGTASKIDPQNQTEVARYCTAPGCNADPSRISVSLDGDAGIANRANYFYGSVLHPERASAVKIAGSLAHCVDRNGNGKIDTNTSAGPVPAQFIWQANQGVSPDECVLWFSRLITDRNGNFIAGAGSLPRSATWDSKANSAGGLSSNLYVGLYGSNELVQLDATTGAIVKQISVPGTPYTSVFDRFGALWIKDANNSVLIRVDTTNNLSIKTYPPSNCNYTLTADARGYIYGSGSNCISRIDPQATSPSWEYLTLPNACFTRGPSLDSAYNLWVPDTCIGAYHVDASAPWGSGMVMKKQITLPNPGPNSDSGYYLGSAIDGSGYPWIIGTQTDNLQLLNGPAGKAFRIDPSNNYSTILVTVGTTPYVYSDLSGSQLALTAPTTGSYNKTFSAFCGSNATWQSIQWTDTVPAQTSIQVRYRGAHDSVSLATAAFVNVGTDQPGVPITQPVTVTLPSGTDPSLLQVEFVLQTNSTANTPALASVSATYSCPAPQ